MKYEINKEANFPESWKGAVLGFDIETDSNDTLSNITLVSLYNPKDDQGYVVPINCQEGPQDYKISSEALERLKELLVSAKLVGHNLSFDLTHTRREWGLKLNPVFDTFLFALMCQFDKNGLKDIITNILGESQVHFEDLNNEFGGRYYYNILDEKIVKYSALDAYYPFVVMNHYKDKVQKCKTIMKLECSFMKSAVELQAFGLRVDEKKLQEVIEEYSTSFAEAQKYLDSLAGHPVRTGSSKDLATLLFDEFEMVPPSVTKSGARSTKAQVLDNLLVTYSTDKEKCDLINAIKAVKDKSSVLSSLKKAPTEVINSHMYPTVKQIGFGTASSRCFTQNPAVQSMPSSFRYCIIPEEGKKFLFFDLAAAELILNAYLSKCSKILTWYRDGKDLHSEIARLLLGRELKSKKERSISKAVVFSSTYGSHGASVARDLHISQEAGTALVDKFFASFPELATFRNQVHNYYLSTGTTCTQFGRVREIAERDVDKGKRIAFNYRIQSTIGDVFKYLVAKARKYESQGVYFKIGVFDSFLFEVPKDFTEEQAKLMIDDLTDMNSLSVFKGLRFNYKFALGDNWGEVHAKC